MKETLLQKAKRIDLNNSVSREDMELALGWLRGEVHTKQLALVKGYGTSGQMTYQFVTRTLKKATQQGWLSWEILDDYTKV